MASRHALRPHAAPPGPLPPPGPAALRAQLEALDRDLLTLLAQRGRLAAQLLEQLPADDPALSERILTAVAQRRHWGARMGLDRGFVEVLFSALIARDVAVAAHGAASSPPD